MIRTNLRAIRSVKINRTINTSHVRMLASKADTSSANYAKVFNPASEFSRLDTFTRRHIGPTPTEVDKMLVDLGYKDVDEFLSNAVPPHVLFKRKLKIQPENGFSELEMLEHLNDLAGKNKLLNLLLVKVMLELMYLQLFKEIY